MRVLAIAALVLLGFALAFVPAASAVTETPARPAPDCDGFLHVERDLGPVTVSATPGQCYDVYVDAFSCPLGGRYQTTSAGPVHVHLYVCNAPNPPPPPTASLQAANIPPVCIEEEVQQGPVRAGYSSCHDEFVEVVNCTPGTPQGIHYGNDLGPASVRVDYCLPHIPPPAAPGILAPAPALASAPVAPDCSKVPDVGTTQTGVITSDDCQVLVSVDPVNCPFGEQWVTNQYGPLTVRHTACREPVPPAWA